MLAGVLTAEYGLGIGNDVDMWIVEVDTAVGGALGAGVAAAVEAGDAAAFALGAGVLAAAGGGFGDSGGGVKMPSRCLASRSFSNLAAFAAALSC